MSRRLPPRHPRNLDFDSPLPPEMGDLLHYFPPLEAVYRVREVDWANAPTSFEYDGLPYKTHFRLIGGLWTNVLPFGG